MHLRTVVYIDGYNLYYGLLRGTKLKWLDIVSLFRDHVLEENTDLVEVRYYTAPVLGRMSDDPKSPQRQRQYLQALRRMYPETSGELVIIEGNMSATKPCRRLVDQIPEAPSLKKVRVYEFREKKTDVNLASDLISGAWIGAYEQAVICSNDSDLEGALTAIRRYHQHRIGIVAPITGDDHRHISRDLSQNASLYCIHGQQTHFSPNR
jgi:uncharacterized LabA/DUF88 family protein